jgi:hypothetical protein
MKDTSDVRTPVQKQLIEYLIDDEVIDALLELLGEDEVKFIDYGKHLLQ